MNRLGSTGRQPGRQHSDTRWAPPATPASVLRRKATLLCSVLSEAYTPSTSSGVPKACGSQRAGEC